ncbi:MAG: patatin-like phospholipase family protein, partial [Vicinamibacteria bacterium]|nr:patatin-like phospholipase family protein [Vicinamibacteria bacterium]
RNPRNRGIGLCLSGGGFRATLFHLGAIQRLFELGIARSPDFETVASVSGGSLTCAQWAIAEAQAKGENRNLDFARDITRPILSLTGTDLRTGPLAKKLLLPWNWLRGAYATNAMVARFETAFGKGTLNLLPDHPRFVFCATDMAFGASFIFDRDRVGSYLAGYAPPEGFTLAQAVAASACFPPLFGPMRIDRAAERFKGGRAPGVSADARRQILQDLRVTDGGVYDNMGLEPVWKSHRVVLVSDAGGLMDAEADKSWTWRIKRYQSIQECQARGVRKRFLISGFTQGTIKGAYIGVGSSTARYAAAREPGYSKGFAMDVIANIRTDLDAFSEVEQAVLMNHGYALIDAAIRTHARELIATDVAFALPSPAFASPTMAEGELRRRLVGSEARKFTGR